MSQKNLNNLFLNHLCLNLILKNEIFCLNFYGFSTSKKSDSIKPFNSETLSFLILS